MQNIVGRFARTQSLKISRFALGPKFKTKAQKKHMVNDIVGTPAPLPQQPSAVGIMLCVVCGGRCSLSRLVPSTAPSLSVSCPVRIGPVSVRSKCSLD
jgi:hypothetical protein